MIWMALFVLSATGFGHTMRHAQVLGRNMPWVGAINYCAATLICAAWWAFTWTGAIGWAAPTLGTMAGIVIAIGYLLLSRAISLAGVAIAQTTARLSMVIPITASIFIWQEIPDGVRGAGLLLAFVSLALLAQGRAVRIASQKEREKLLALAAFFVGSGALSLLLKCAAEHVAARNRPGFLFFTFAVASVATLAVAVGRGARPGSGDGVHGAALGAMNVLTNGAMIGALTTLPGWVVFPTTSAGSIVVTTCAAVLLWRERFRGSALAGMAIAVIAIVLMNVDLSQLFAALKS